MSEPFKNEWTPEMARDIDKYWGTSAVEMALHIVETVGILQSGKPGYSVLEAGCGTGRIYELLKQSPIGLYTGLDASPAMLDIFKEKFSTVPLVCGDVQALPFDDGSFDLVACVEVLRHMQYYDVAVKELVRVAKHAAVFSIEVTQGETDYVGEMRAGAYLVGSADVVHYQVERNSQEVIQWVTEEFDYAVDIKLVTSKKWLFIVNKDRPGRSLTLSPLGGMDSFIAVVANSAGDAFRLFRAHVPGKTLKWHVKANVESLACARIGFGATLEVLDVDKSSQSSDNTGGGK